MAHGFMRPNGALAAKRIRTRGPGLGWKLRNTARWSFIKGWIAFYLIAPLANWWGVATLIGELRATLIKANGERINYGVLGYRVVTDAGVAFIVDDWDGSVTDVSNFKYHGCGTGTTNEAAGDTALVTESTTALNPDSTRATGTNSQPSANIFRSVGTLTFDADAAVTEHGLFSQAATGGGTLWDRTKFAAINVVGANADSIQFTYSVTLSSGG
jgi:hypothetical protein